MLSGDADDDADHAGRGQQGRPQVADRLELEENDGGRQKHDDHRGDPFDNPELGENLAHAEAARVVFFDALLGQFNGDGDDFNDNPGAEQDERRNQHIAGRGHNVGVLNILFVLKQDGQGDYDKKQRQHEAQGPAQMLDDDVLGGLVVFLGKGAYQPEDEKLHE